LAIFHTFPQIPLYYFGQIDYSAMYFSSSTPVLCEWIRYHQRRKT